jgi:hypothetical protein
MDLVYITSAAGNENELRYSIRSFYKHLKGFNRVVVCGHRPAFLKGVIYIPVEDPHRNNPARNIYEKILAVCQRDGITSDFICSSDDIFLMRDFEAPCFPYYFTGPMSEVFTKLSEKNYYKGHVKTTLDALTNTGKPSLYYNLHCPVVYNRQKFLQVMPAYDWTIKKGYISKSLYCNNVGVTGERADDCKIHTPKTSTAIRRKIEGKPFFSTNKHSFTAKMEEVLEQLFPIPSPWET